MLFYMPMRLFIISKPLGLLCVWGGEWYCGVLCVSVCLL